MRGLIESETENLTNEMISEMFCEYVNSMEDNERHTEEACNEVENFCTFTEKVFPEDTKKQTEAYDKMMNVAVEYEEGGFIAGVRWVIRMMKESTDT